MTDIWKDLLYLDRINRGKLFTAKLLQLGGVRYPKFGNILIMAGGSGSGKGCQLKNLVGLDGKVLDVDKLKVLVLENEFFRKLFKKKYNREIKSDSLKDPEFTRDLHNFMKEQGIKERVYNSLNYIADIKERKPNLIFDVTLSDLEQFQTICTVADRLGYDRKNVHLIWVINTLEVALEQNASRTRMVPENIVKQIHRNVAGTMYDICKMGSSVTQYLDGDIWFSFNQKNVDVKVKTQEKNISENFVIKEANMIKIKSAGGPIQFPKEEVKELTQKIYEYTKFTDWSNFEQ